MHTRMILLRVSRHVLQVRIMGGEYDGNVELIPRVSLTPTSTCVKTAFSLRRRPNVVYPEIFQAYGTFVFSKPLTVST